jgi:hypothetical protein
MNKLALLLVFATALMLGVACSGEGPGQPPIPIYQIGNWDELEGRSGCMIHATFESKTKGRVPFCAYLPPGWDWHDTIEYPMVIHLYGQGGNEYSFAYAAMAEELNLWISEGELPPMVIMCVSGSRNPDAIQWYTPENEILLTADAPGELRDFAHRTLHTTMSSDSISIQGHSRGAAGTLFYTFKHSDLFASSVVYAYVSDYTLDNFKQLAVHYKADLLSNQYPLLMEIGTNDRFVIEDGRVASPVMHAHLDSLGIAHSYDTLQGCSHGYVNFWRHIPVEKNEYHGINHLKFHAAAWGWER